MYTRCNKAITIRGAFEYVYQIKKAPLLTREGYRFDFGSELAETIAVMLCLSAWSGPRDSVTEDC